MAKKVSDLAMVESHLDLVEPIARGVVRSLPPGLEVQDLVQAGVIGLIDAVRTFREGKVPFAVHAKLRIRGAILDSVRTERHEAYLAPRRHGKEGTLPKPELTRCEMPAETAAGSDLRAPGRRQLQMGMRLATAVAELPHRERRLIELLYDHNLTCAEAGRILGLRESWVRELRRRAISRLRNLMAA